MLASDAVIKQRRADRRRHGGALVVLAANAASTQSGPGSLDLWLIGAVLSLVILVVSEIWKAVQRRSCGICG